MKNIDLYTLRILVSAGLLILAGLSRAIFECIIFFDTPKKYLGSYYSRDLFYSNKDRNNDGKVSYWENNFPDDGGHRIKLVELICLITAGIGFINLNGWQSIIYIVFSFMIYSYSFEQFFKKYRI